MIKSLTMLLAIALSAGPAMADPTAPAPAPGLFAAGYKVGNGLGPLGLALSVQPVPRWGFDLQLARSPIGVDWAPAVRYQLDPAAGWYASAGVNRTALEIFGQGRARHGLFANVGREWTPWPRVGLVAGVGYQVALPSTETAFGQSVYTAGWGGLNLELGVRYYFL